MTAETSNARGEWVLERLRGVLEHGKMGDKCLIAPDLVTAAIASLSAPPPAAEGVQAGECCVPDAGEPSFVLLGRDPQAPALIEAWAADRERAEPDSDKPAKARAIAVAMREYKAANPGKGLPASALSQQPEPKAEARGVVDEGSRSVTSQLLHWGGIPVRVTGTVTTSPGNWPLIDAALTEARDVP